MLQQSSERQGSIMEHVSNFTLNSWRRVISVVNVINRLVIVGDRNQSGLNHHMNSKKSYSIKIFFLPRCLQLLYGVHSRDAHCTVWRLQGFFFFFSWVALKLLRGKQALGWESKLKTEVSTEKLSLSSRSIKAALCVKLWPYIIQCREGQTSERANNNQTFFERSEVRCREPRLMRQAVIGIKQTNQKSPGYVSFIPFPL